ncbi:MAG: hypothetical protein OEM02_17440 [Desulfobulbaceae bacterium]|nr:hypothetical protein [Desulfobulbaceae bacterium]
MKSMENFFIKLMELVVCKVWLGFILFIILIASTIPLGAVASELDGVRFVPGGPKGMPRGYAPGDRFIIRVEKGSCLQSSLPVMVNPVSGVVVQMVASLPDGTFQVVMGNARGVAQLVVHCLDDPEMEPMRMLVSNNGGYGPFEPTEIRSWLEAPPPPLQFSETQKKYLRNQADTQGGADTGDNGEAIQPGDDGMGVGSVILLGTAVGAGVVVAAVAGSSGGLAGKTTCCENSSSRICNTSWGLVCCPSNYPVACSNRKCYAIGSVPRSAGDCLVCRPDDCITNNVSGRVMDPDIAQIINGEGLSNEEQCVTHQPDQRDPVEREAQE